MPSTEKHQNGRPGASRPASSPTYSFQKKKKPLNERRGQDGEMRRSTQQKAPCLEQRYGDRPKQIARSPCSVGMLGIMTNEAQSKSSTPTQHPNHTALSFSTVACRYQRIERQPFSCYCFCAECSQENFGFGWFSRLTLQQNQSTTTDTSRHSTHREIVLLAPTAMSVGKKTGEGISPGQRTRAIDATT